MRYEVVFAANIAFDMGETVCETGTISLLMRVMRLIGRRDTEEVVGMRLKHLITLSHLRDQNGDERQAALGESLCMDANNLVLLLNEMEGEGFIERRRDPSDRRRHLVAITKPGSRALGKAEMKLETLEGDILRGLDPDERVQLRELLGKVLAGHCAIHGPEALLDGEPLAAASR